MLMYTLQCIHFGSVMYLASVYGVIGYLLVLHESLEHFGISRLVDHGLPHYIEQAPPPKEKECGCCLIVNS